MLVFGHAGITLGAATLLASVLGSGRFSKITVKKEIEPSSQSFKNPQTPSNKTSWLTSLGSRLDIRLLLVGSLLPDIIDKPVGLFFFRETFSNGRIFCHTLLFLILVTVTGLYLYRWRGKTWLLAFSFGTLAHHICDQMWRIPQTLFWPLFGLNFERADISDWASKILYGLFTEPTIYVPELVGAVIIIWFAWTLLRTRKTYVFIKSGRIR